ncbi:hypothetical protein OROGR_031318 [Orobanche gracilis]
MEVRLVLVDAFRPLFGFPTTRHNKTSKPRAAAAAKFATSSSQKVSAPASFNGSERGGEVRRKAINVSKRTSKNLWASHKTRESAILDIQDSSDLASALLRIRRSVESTRLECGVAPFWEAKEMEGSLSAF